MKLPLRQVSLLLALAFVPAVGQAIYYRNKVSWRSPVAASDEIKLSEALALGDQVMWVDARPDDEYQAEHIPGALALSEDHWNESLPQLVQVWAPEKKVVVYCSSKECGASREVARRLKSNAGLTNVFVLSGGWEAWKQR